MIVLLIAVMLAQSGTLIERTLAIVGGRVITWSDQRTAMALGLVEGGADAALERLVERELMLREVERYAPPEPTEAAIEARLTEVRRQAPSPDELRRMLELGAFTEDRLRSWVRDDLRIAAYLGQRFAAAGVPSDQEVAAAYARDRADFERSGLTFEAAAPLLRERLSADRRRELIADWVADLRRRADVTILSGSEER
jgi:hypothetical protein